MTQSEFRLRGVGQSQRERVLELLKRHPITPLDALCLGGGMRLSARIGELSKQGHTITRRMVLRGAARVAQYTLEGEGEKR